MEIRIVRSARRARTISARMDGDVLEVLAPAHMSDAELAPIIERLRGRLERRRGRRGQPPEDAELAQIAQRLNRAHFSGQLRWSSIVWSERQAQRYGSCTPATGAIRISSRLAQMPRFVLEYVVMHELAHLLEANHGPRFWQLVARYPLAERARGYLMAVGLEGLDQPPDDLET